MKLKSKDIIPADGKLTSDFCTVDYAFVTGESRPVEVLKGNTLFAGGKVMSGAVTYELDKEVSTSYLTGLWEEEGKSIEHQKENSLQRFTDKVGKIFTILIITIALTAGIYWYFLDSGKAVSVMVSILIVACPCALALSIPFTFGNALRILSKKGLAHQRCNYIGEYVSGRYHHFR